MGAVEKMMGVVYVSVKKGHSGDGGNLASTLCKYVKGLFICSQFGKGATSEAGKYLLLLSTSHDPC